MRALLLLFSLLFTLQVAAQIPAAAEEVFAEPPSAEAQAWLDDAVTAYNEKMVALRRDWLVNVAGARTDTPRRQVIFETANGTVVFDAKSIGGLGKPGEKWLWMWSWSSTDSATNFRLPSAALHEIGTALQLPFLTTAKFYSKSPDLPFLIGAVALKVYGGVGVHRVHVPHKTDPYDVYYLLSNPRRRGD